MNGLQPEMQQQTLLEEEKLDTTQIIQQLRSKNPAVRKALERKLVAKQADGLNLILDIIRQEEHKRKSRTTWSNILFSTTGFIFGSGQLLASHFGKSDLSGFCLIGCAMLLSVLIIAISVLLRDISKVEKGAIQALAQFDSIQAVGPLVAAVGTWEANPARNAISFPLKALLPRMRRSDATLLNSEQRRALYWIMLTSQDTELVIAILKALEQIGDSQALPYVEKLATGRVKTTGTAVGATRRQIRIFLMNANMRGRIVSAKEEQQIQKAAQECLPCLQEQAGAGQQTLLRAADPLSQPTETLLRPSTSTSDQSPQELLRAHSPEELIE